MYFAYWFTSPCIGICVTYGLWLLERLHCSVSVVQIWSAKSEGIWFQVLLESFSFTQLILICFQNSASSQDIYTGKKPRGHSLPPPKKIMKLYCSIVEHCHHSCLSWPWGDSSGQECMVQWSMTRLMFDMFNNEKAIYSNFMGVHGVQLSGAQ